MRKKNLFLIRDHLELKRVLNRDWRKSCNCLLLRCYRLLYIFTCYKRKKCEFIFILLYQIYSILCSFYRPSVTFTFLFGQSAEKWAVFQNNIATMYCKKMAKIFSTGLKSVICKKDDDFAPLIVQQRSVNHFCRKKETNPCDVIDAIFTLPFFANYRRADSSFNFLRTLRQSWWIQFETETTRWNISVAI